MALPSEEELTRLYTDLVDFYQRYKPTNITEDILTIIMQFFIDAGAPALNQKLRQKYGEDLQSFRLANMKLTANNPVDNSRASQAVNRLSLRNSLESELGMMFRPPQKNETSLNIRTFRTSLEAPLSRPYIGTGNNPRRKRVNADPELAAFKKRKEQERLDLENDLFNDPIDMEEENDKKLGLYMLDMDNNEKPAVIDLLHAFYSKYDQEKMMNNNFEAILTWIDQNSFDDFEQKLFKKYGDKLENYHDLAKRRMKLSTLYTNFLMQHDRHKLQEPKVIIQLVQWTLEHGVYAANEKLKTRYGYVLLAVSNAIDIDLEI